MNFSQYYEASLSARAERLFYQPARLYFGNFSEKFRPHGSSLYCSQGFHNGGKKAMSDAMCFLRLLNLLSRMVFGIFGRNLSIHTPLYGLVIRFLVKGRLEYHHDLFREVV